MRFRSALPATLRWLLLGALLAPPAAVAQAPEWNWRYCRLGEPCWDRLIENGDRSIQEKMREAQAAAARIRSPDPQARPKDALAAPARLARSADAGAAAGKPQPGDPADDMRFWSTDDCSARYDYSAGDLKECVAFVTSDAAKQARVDRACKERFPADANEYDRCRLPLQSDATAQAAAAAAAAARAALVAGAASGAPLRPAAAPTAAAASAASRATSGAADSPDALAPLGGVLLLLVTLGLGAVAVRCWKPQLGWPQVCLGSCMGAFSGVMFYLLAALTIAGQTVPASAAFAMVAVVGGWAASVWLILNGAISVARVINRGFLLGVVEWMLMIPAGLFYASRMAAASFAVGGSAAHETVLFGVSTGFDLLAFLSGGIAVVMAGVCLVGFAVSYFISGQLEPEAPRAKRKCPECAEMIQAEASKCRYCGAMLKRKSPKKTAARTGPRTVTHTAARGGPRSARGSG